MKKINIILICIIISLISGIIGFFLGINIKDEIKLNKAEKDIVGTYKTSTWNGGDAVLVLNEDKTCIHPTGSKGKWYLEDNKLYLEIEYNHSYMDGTSETKKSTSKQEAIVVDKGIMINTHFFEKVK